MRGCESERRFKVSSRETIHGDAVSLSAPFAATPPRPVSLMGAKIPASKSRRSEGFASSADCLLDEEGISLDKSESLQQIDSPEVRNHAF